MATASEMVDTLTGMVSKMNNSEREWVGSCSARLETGPAFTSRELALMQIRIDLIGAR